MPLRGAVLRLQLVQLDRGIYDPVGDVAHPRWGVAGRGRCEREGNGQGRGHGQ